MTDSIRRYLAAKRTVDDRAMNRRVRDRFAAGLADRAGARGTDPVRIVEVGAGIGTMVARLAEWNALPEQVTYRAVDHDRRSVAYARDHLPERLEDAGYEVERTADGLSAIADGSPTVPPDGVVGSGVDGRRRPRRLDIAFEVADAFAIEDEADAVIAAAFLDVVGLDALEALRELLVDDGLLYAPITFDGKTAFSPPDPDDDRIERRYHRHVDALRAEPDRSRTGRELLAALPGAGYEILAAGGADWIVRPHGETYPGDEAYFLEELLSTIEGALEDDAADEPDPEVRRRWFETRRDQLDRGELVLVAHHLDVLARACGQGG